MCSEHVDVQNPSSQTPRPLSASVRFTETTWNVKRKRGIITGALATSDHQQYPIHVTWHARLFPRLKRNMLRALHSGSQWGGWRARSSSNQSIGGSVTGAACVAVPLGKTLIATWHIVPLLRPCSTDGPEGGLCCYRSSRPSQRGTDKWWGTADWHLWV